MIAWSCITPPTKLFPAGREYRTAVALRLGARPCRTRSARRQRLAGAQGAKLKNRIREIAGELIKIAAERHLHEAPKMPVQPHAL
jgi:hypothetical protein